MFSLSVFNESEAVRVHFVAYETVLPRRLAYVLPTGIDDVVPDRRWPDPMTNKMDLGSRFYPPTRKTPYDCSIGCITSSGNHDGCTRSCITKGASRPLQNCQLKLSDNTGCHA